MRKFEKTSKENNAPSEITPHERHFADLLKIAQYQKRVPYFQTKGNARPLEVCVANEQGT